MRLFVAIALTQRDRTRLQQIRDVLAAAPADVRWVEPENLHLTLRFLGEVQADRLEPIENVISDAVRAQRAPELQLGGLGVFPARGAPRVVWCGMQRGGEALRVLVGRLEKGLQPLGFAAEDRPYTPHITLGRVRSRHNSAALRRTCETTAAEDFVAFVPTEVLLVESRLSPAGARYSVRRRFAFAEGG